MAVANRRTEVNAARLLRLAFVMLRYRAALMIWLFMLLGVARHGGLDNLGAGHLAVLAALACSYIAATSVNDIADQELDRVNHPGDPARPLVTGAANERDLWIVYVGAAVGALGMAAVAGSTAIAIVLLGLLFGFVYSMPPLTLSYRTYLSPLVLAVAYVVIPYALGVVATRQTPEAPDVLPLTGLGALFLARILLKDFRDLEGDALYGRRTLLQRHGRAGVCRASLACLVLADVLLTAALLPPPVLTLALQCFFVAIVWLLWQVEIAPNQHREQVAIGIGARLGNGLLILLLGVWALQSTDASMGETALFALTLTAVFALNVAGLMTRPDEVLVGYKG